MHVTEKKNNAGEDGLNKRNTKICRIQQQLIWIGGSIVFHNKGQLWKDGETLPWHQLLGTNYQNGCSNTYSPFCADSCILCLLFCFCTGQKKNTWRSKTNRSSTSAENLDWLPIQVYLKPMMYKTFWPPQHLKYLPYLCYICYDANL